MSSKVDLITDSLKNEKYTSNIINNQTNHPYPCIICVKNVNNNQKAMYCDYCESWIHIKCQGMPEKLYNEIIDLNSKLSDREIIVQKWQCIKCSIKINAENFPYGLEKRF